ncbi:hypothetical protein CAPTEDRAFT_188220 [Capitella teleta]|uniref:G-protein coupled receptors family 1 profile domain-containing protein n=1 Tax=Capitella teleta TaxID=283909 RepID=R7VF57_CAPTE|nr:hypothetical protein CAPTEDRAFT_188220 [Capitella teleta]|eukprot:ELU17244.1 hypothetical protein CAPTEDRAFT_188220 [Capitella teleta]
MVITFNCSSNHYNPETCVSHEFILGLRVYQGIASVLGILGSLMTITAIALHKRLQTVPNAYLVNLSAADLVVCSLLIPFSMYTVGQRLDQPYCQLIGYPNLVTLMTSVMNLSLVAVNRYIVVCRSRDLYAKIYTLRGTALTIAFPWVFTLLLFSPPFFGFGRYDYNAKFGVCIFMSGDFNTYWFVFGLADCTIMFPTLPLTLFCYVSIMIKFRDSRRKVGNVPANESTVNTNNQGGRTETTSEASHQTGPTAIKSTTNENVQTLQKKKQKESGKQMRAVIKNMFVIWMTFMLFWMPLVMTYKIDYFSNVANEVYHVLFAIAQSNSAVNFIIYCAMNKNFREAYINILTLKAFKRS